VPNIHPTAIVEEGVRLAENVEVGPFCVLRGAITIGAGTTSDHIGGFQDLLPTVADLAETATPSGIDGISIAPTLTGQGGQADHDYLFWEFHEGGSPETAIPTVPVRDILAAMRPARYAPSCPESV